MLIIKNISKKFKEKKVLSNINITISKGNSISILGNNGAGKTTLIKIIIGLLTPTTGEIIFNNSNINEIKNKYLNLIGVVLEGNRNIYWYLSSMENLYYFGRLLGMSDKNIKDKGFYLLKLFDLYNVKDNKVSTFSRGMQQKLAIIIALLNSPKILFLDEPTLGLDVISKNKLIQCLIQIKNEGTIIILTTHQLDIVTKITDSIYFLKNGYLLTELNSNLISQFEEPIIELSLKNRKTLNLLNGPHIQFLIKFLIENNEIILSLNQREKNIEEIFLEIYKEKTLCLK